MVIPPHRHYLPAVTKRLIFVLVHGDFHWDNLLKTDDGRICVCDWQNVAIGGASEDLSFFMSRLGADGIQIDLDKMLNMYSNAEFLYA